VENATKGKYLLDIKWYPVGTLLDGAKIYDGVVTGVAEAGTSSFGYNPGRFPVILTLNQPGIAPPENSDAAAHTVWEHYNKWKPKELEDVKMLYLYATGPGWIHSRKPIRKVEDMKGLKIRVTGAGIGGVKAVGGGPVAMVMGEVYLAAQKGVIDANVAPLEVLEGWKHNEVFEYSTFVPQFYSEFFYVVMNWAKWKALPKDLQDAFDAVAGDAVKEAGQIWQYNQKKGADYAKRGPGGHEFIVLSDTEVAKLKKLLEPISGEYIALLKSKGLPGEEIVKEAGNIVEKYNKLKYEPWKP
jgi:TRAP-type C4-dicarboxylate transport system substrate-binding protein